jgi:hypothetical protein
MGRRREAPVAAQHGDVMSTVSGQEQAVREPRGFAGAYCVELLYERLPTIPKGALLQSLSRRCPDIAPLDGKLDTGPLAFAHTKHGIRYKDATLPAQCLVAAPDKPFDPAGLQPALQQSWWWPQAREVVARCRASVLVTDMMSAALDYRERLELFQKALAATLETAPALAIHWRPTGQCVNPQTFLDAVAQHGYRHPLPGAINVRFYRISGYKAEKETTTEDMLTDTLGLAALGLPDLQCHFRRLNPDSVVRILYNAACYLFEKGPVIQNGHTIPGPSPGEKWLCRCEKALLGPERTVIDLDPGPPASAGRRGA